MLYPLRNLHIIFFRSKICLQQISPLVKRCTTQGSSPRFVIAQDLVDLWDLDFGDGRGPFDGGDLIMLRAVLDYAAGADYAVFEGSIFFDYAV